MGAGGPARRLPPLPLGLWLQRLAPAWVLQSLNQAVKLGWQGVLSALAATP